MADDRDSFSTSLFPTSPSPELILQEVTPSAEELIKMRLVQCLRNFTITAVTLGGITTAVVMWWQGRIPEATRLSDLLGRFTTMT